MRGDIRMGIEQIKNLDIARALYGRDVFEKTMKDTDDYIKFNRVGFNKTTSAKQYMKIFYICLGVCVRVER